MTINQLSKILQREIKRGRGRRKVAVDKESLWDGNNTFSICNVEKAEVTQVVTVDGDGFHVENKDGTERSRMMLVLTGSPWA